MPPGMIPNPTKKKTRPSSAAANLQTHSNFNTGLFGNGRPSTASGQSKGAGVLPPRPKTQAGGPRYWGKPAQTSISETLDTTQRRLTVAEVDGISEARPNAGRPPGHVSLNEHLKGKIEEKISLETLEELKQAFLSVDTDGNGQLDLSEFKVLLKQQLNIPVSKEGQIDALFQKIDWSSNGEITWNEFCTYMQLEYAEKEDSYLRAKEVVFHLPARSKNMPHREPVLRITDTSDGAFMACSQDGLMTFWSPSIELKRQRTVVPPEMTSRTKSKWVTDFTIMGQYNKIIVGTGDREIQFFELSSFEPYCQINSLESVPLKLDYCSTGHDECLVLFGDSEGCVNILVISSAGECLRTWKKAPKADGIASIAIDQVATGLNTKFIRWKVHGDWVQQIKYYHELRQVMSCSNHTNTALVIGCTIGSTHVEQQLKEIKDPVAAAERARIRQSTNWNIAKPRLEADQSVFKVYKGVKFFHFSKEKNLIVTGGMDRIVRMWNPYVPGKPTGMLRGHNAPIFYLFIAEEENRIFSISTDKCIKVWDTQDQNCLITLRPKGHKILGDLQACHYSNISKTLAIATDKMNGLQLRLRPVQHADIPITHKDPIHSVVFNPSFKQVVTCSDGSVIKIWDYETGIGIFEYGEAHGEHPITCMTFDTTGRRLITGGRDGCIRMWNFNNGHCLQTMMKEADNEEICALTYVEMNKNRYVISVGWDKHINMYCDTLDNTAHIHSVEHPLPKWADDEHHNGHKDDILSVALSTPNLLATSSYDGEVIVWNLVSGHIFCHLMAPSPPNYTDIDVDGDLSINKVVFLRTRSFKKDAASLVASGPRGYIHFWNVFQGGTLMAQFRATRISNSMVTAMEVTKMNRILVSADSYGFIYVWNIEGYCSHGIEPKSPELLMTWRAHVESVTCLQLVEEQKIVISSSLDCTVRMWTFDGDYVGTFGQPDAWDIYKKSTFQHPMVPYDVLVDPLSMPDHPILRDEKQEMISVVMGDNKADSIQDSPSQTIKEKEDPQVSLSAQYAKQQFFVDDATIADMLKEKPFNNGTGKRLRHEKKKPARVDRGGPSEYQMLTCYNLEPTPQIEPPKHLHKDKEDEVFDFINNIQTSA